MNNKQRLETIKDMALEALEHRIGDSHTEFVLETIIKIVDEMKAVKSAVPVPYGARSPFEPEIDL